MSTPVPFGIGVPKGRRRCVDIGDERAVAQSEAAGIVALLDSVDLCSASVPLCDQHTFTR